jgi:hypothetical protein
MMLEDFRTGKASYELARRAIQFSRNERRQSPLLRTLHAMALRRLDALRAAEPAPSPSEEETITSSSDGEGLNGGV